MHRTVRFWAVLCAILMLAGTAFSQIQTATLSGRITDQQGRVVPGASVEVINVDTNVAVRTESNTVGLYVAPYLIPGSYRIVIRKPGFAEIIKTGLTFHVQDAIEQNFELSVGSVTQSIQVAGAAPLVNTENVNVGEVIENTYILNLPLNGRNFTQLLALTPGVSPVNVSQASMTNAVGTFVLPAVNGQRNRSNLFMTDGVNNEQVCYSTYAVPPIVDAIQEFKVVSHNDQAEFGGVTGGVINVVSRSGTNELHGTLWEFLKNDALNARTYFISKVTPFKQNQFGASGGGPVVLPHVYNGHNRTFFFLAYQGYRFRTPSNAYAVVPTAANLNGDFSNWSKQIYDPYTTTMDSNGAFHRTALAGNIVPTSELNQGMIKWAKAVLPAAIVTGVSNYTALDTTQRRSAQEEYTGRIDQNFGAKDSVWFRYSGLRLDTTGSGGVSTLESDTVQQSTNTGVSWVHIFNPSTVLQAQFGRTVVNSGNDMNFRGISSASVDSDAGFVKGLCCSFISGITVVPQMVASGFLSSVGESHTTWTPSDLWLYKASLAKMHGKHSLKFGAEFNQSGYAQVYTQASLTFAAAQTGNPQSYGTTGDPLASLLMGLVDTATKRGQYTTMRFGGGIAFYFQDQWKLTPRLSLNYGLRYDRTFIPPTGRPDDPTHNMEVGNMDYNRGVYVIQMMSPSCAARGQAPCIPGGTLPANVVVSPNGKLLEDTVTDFQPRLGLAYRLGSKTAIRASYGVLFDSWAGYIQSAQRSAPNWPSMTQFSLGPGLNYPTSTQLTPTQFPSTVDFGVLSEATPFTRFMGYLDPRMRDPYSLQWTIGVQHQLDQATVLTVNYVGSSDQRLNLGLIYNTALTPGTGTWTQRVPFPGMTDSTTDFSWGKANYNALQVSLDRHFSKGLAYLISYTWSKSIDNGASGYYASEGWNIQDQYHWNTSRSVSAFDIPQTLSMSWVYHLPLGSGTALSTHNRWLDYAIGKWQVNAITTLSSGVPYTIYLDGDNANVGNTSRSYMRPNLVGNPKVSQRTQLKWFDKSAFGAPATYTYGNLGRNTMRTDWTRNIDLSLFRQFSFSEKRRLEFRCDAFDATNTPIFGTPVADMSNTQFGQVWSTNGARTMQLSLKLVY